MCSSVFWLSLPILRTWSRPSNSVRGRSLLRQSITRIVAVRSKCSRQDRDFGLAGRHHGNPAKDLCIVRTAVFWFALLTLLRVEIIAVAARRVGRAHGQPVRPQRDDSLSSFRVGGVDVELVELLARQEEDDIAGRHVELVAQLWKLQMSAGAQDENHRVILPCNMLDGAM